MSTSTSRCSQTTEQGEDRRNRGSRDPALTLLAAPLHVTTYPTEPQPHPSDSPHPTPTSGYSSPAVTQIITSPFALSTILNPSPPISPPGSVAPKKYRELHFLPVVQQGITRPPTKEYRFITPLRGMDTAAATRYRMYTEDYRSPPIKIRVEGHTALGNILFFTVTSTPRTIITEKNVLRPDGEISGRWIIEEHLCKTKDYTLVRIKERYEKIITILAIPRCHIKIADPPSH
ncbi:hypothetical protein DFH06DRAFT_1339957 [Mycena polygramma]|nr:hypothetical protein DFH06DRAFT_1339957 [Mycena polygramma]